jgi:hypothetical protein
MIMQSNFFWNFIPKTQISYQYNLISNLKLSFQTLPNLKSKPYFQTLNPKL